MKMINNSICALIAALAIGCQGGTVSNTNKIINSTNVQTIRGKPISVSETYGQSTGTVATVLDVEGNKVLAHVSLDQNSGGNRITTVAQATALIQSEINDGDDDLVELTGKYVDGVFQMSSLSANGYKVDF